MTNLIEPTSGVSTSLHLEKLQRLKRVMGVTKKRKVGRGQKAIFVEDPKWAGEMNNKIREDIEFSIKHYEKDNMFEFRDYQLDIKERGLKILNRFGLLYLSMEVRTGKTLTSLGIADNFYAKSVLFITKKKAISSIEDDYHTLNPSFKLEVINYESLHKLEGLYDLVILDEAHSMGAFAKPSKRAIQVKALLEKNNQPATILLSGTPTPESYSQMYHQVYGHKNNPFRQYTSFYKFAKDLVDVTQKKINSFMINDYTKGKMEILDMMKPYTISYSQVEAGFKVETKEHILEVEMSPLTYKLCKALKRDLVIEGKDEIILADTPVKLMMKLHQMFSGTVKFESGASKILDLSKAKYIHDNFADAKVGIFYKFTEELNALKEVYGDNLCTTLEEFDTTCKSIALQIVSGREGISLRKAEALVYYNIDFSATSYWQSRDRMTTKDRLESDIYWVFAKGGIEHDIHKAVMSKKSYTLKHFKRDNK